MPLRESTAAEANRSNPGGTAGSKIASAPSSTVGVSSPSQQGSDEKRLVPRVGASERQTALSRDLVEDRYSRVPEHASKDKDIILGALEVELGYEFREPALLDQALTHSSLRHEQQLASQANVAKATTSAHVSGDNERLEFLGDAIVGMLVADSLYRRFPDLREGELTRIRAALVSRKHLGEVGATLNLGRWLRMGRAEEKNGGRRKSVLLANCVEAITAALYLDSGSMQVPRSFVERVIVEPEADALHRELQAKHAIGDYKSALQEFLQARGFGQPEYTVKAESGPDHRKRFLVQVSTAATDLEGERILAEGSGSTKKKAEQEAALRAFRLLGGEAEEPARGTA